MLYWFDLPETLRAQLEDMIRVARDEGRFNDLLAGEYYLFAVVDTRTGTVLVSDIPEPSDRSLERLPRIGRINVPRELVAQA